MGGLGGIMGMLPGLGKMQKQIAAAGIDDSMIRRQEAIILSMTKKERSSVGLLNASRRKRIAAGSGTSVQEVNRVVKQYQEMAKMMKKLGGKSRASMMKALMGGGMGGMGGGMPGGMPGGAPGGTSGVGMPGLGGLGGGLPGNLPGGKGGLPGLPGGLPGLGGKPSGKKK